MSIVRVFSFLAASLVISVAGCQFPKNNDLTDNSGMGANEPDRIEAAKSSSSVSPANFESQLKSSSDMTESRSSGQIASDAQQPETAVTNSNDSKISKKQSLAESFLFQPLKYPRGFTRLEIEGQRVKFDSEDGTHLEARFFIAPKARGVIVFCHGNGGNLASRTTRMETIKDRYGYSVFLFDYRGYGRSEGKPTVSGVIADGRAAIRKAAEMANVKPSDVIVMGRSLGGAVAIQLAAEFQSSKLIVESAFTSFRDIARHHVSFLSGFAKKNDLDAISALGRYRGPVLFSHAVNDKVVPFKHGKKLYLAANEPKQFYEVAEGGHNDAMPEGYRRILGEFLNR